ncbi:hypothetical protein ACU4GD_13790 [Cupriavidus basilensis]
MLAHGEHGTAAQLTIRLPASALDAAHAALRDATHGRARFPDADDGEAQSLSNGPHAPDLRSGDAAGAARTTLAALGRPRRPRRPPLPRASSRWAAAFPPCPRKRCWKPRCSPAYNSPVRAAR